MPIRTFAPPLQIVVCSQAEALYRKASPSEAIVSIRTPGAPTLDLFGYLDRVDLECHPLPDGVNPSWAIRWSGAHTGALLTFMDSLPDTVNTLIIHCGEGKVRSAGVAIGLLEAWNRTSEVQSMEIAYPRHSRDIRDIIARLARRWGPRVPTP